jgi:hypothetical protein
VDSQGVAVALRRLLQVMQELGIKKAGPQLGQLLDQLMDWQLAHPDGTADEAKAQVKQLWAGMQQAGQKN